MINKLLELTGIELSKLFASPINGNMMVDEADSDQLNVEEYAPYEFIVRSIMYIATQARPDLLVATSMLSPHLQEPQVSHRRATKRAILYVNGRKRCQMVMKLGSDDQPTMSVDASWDVLFLKNSIFRSGVLEKYGSADLAGTTNL